MWVMLVEVMDPGAEALGALGGVLVDEAIGPLARCAPDVVLGLAVVWGPMRAGGPDDWVARAVAAALDPRAHRPLPGESANVISVRASTATI